MGQFSFEQCLDIKGLLSITPKIYPDERGYNYEAYNYMVFHEAGLGMDFVQINQSMSKKVF